MTNLDHYISRGRYVLIAVVLLVGCHPSQSWWVDMPKQLAAPTVGYVPFRAEAEHGGIKPGPIQDIVAQCDDPTICVACVVHAQKLGESSEVRVFGKRAGATTLLVDVEHPYARDGTRERRGIPVQVAGSSSAPSAPDGDMGVGMLTRDGNVNGLECTQTEQHATTAR